ncbi:hypothetical protein GCM10009528_36780 [Kineococcus aurantiacus]
MTVDVRMSALSLVATDRSAKRFLVRDAPAPGVTAAVGMRARSSPLADAVVVSRAGSIGNGVGNLKRQRRAGQSSRGASPSRRRARPKA